MKYMKEYIERTSVHSIIEQTSAITFTRGGMHEKIDSLPAADVALVRHGRWIDLNVENSTGPLFKCSECSHLHNPNRNDLELKRVKLKPLYCDACGTRMDKEND